MLVGSLPCFVRSNIAWNCSTKHSLRSSELTYKTGRPTKTTVESAIKTGPTNKLVAPISTIVGPTNIPVGPSSTTGVLTNMRGGPTKRLGGLKRKEKIPHAGDKESLYVFG